MGIDERKVQNSEVVSASEFTTDGGGSGGGGMAAVGFASPWMGGRGAGDGQALMVPTTPCVLLHGTPFLGAAAAPATPFLGPPATPLSYAFDPHDHLSITNTPASSFMLMRSPPLTVPQRPADRGTQSLTNNLVVPPPELPRAVDGVVELPVPWRHGMLSPLRPPKPDPSALSIGADLHMFAKPHPSHSFHPPPVPVPYGRYGDDEMDEEEEAEEVDDGGSVDKTSEGVGGRRRGKTTHKETRERDIRHRRAIVDTYAEKIRMLWYKAFDDGFSFPHCSKDVLRQHLPGIDLSDAVLKKSHNPLLPHTFFDNQTAHLRVETFKLANAMQEELNAHLWKRRNRRFGNDKKRWHDKNITCERKPTLNPFDAVLPPTQPPPPPRPPHTGSAAHPQGEGLSFARMEPVPATVPGVQGYERCRLLPVRPIVVKPEPNTAPTPSPSSEDVGMCDPMEPVADDARGPRPAISFGPGPGSSLDLAVLAATAAILDPPTASFETPTRRDKTTSTIKLPVVASFMRRMTPQAPPRPTGRGSADGSFATRQKLPPPVSLRRDAEGFAVPGPVRTTITSIRHQPPAPPLP